MKHPVATSFVALAALALGIVAWRAQPRTYAGPEPETLDAAPVALTGEVPADCVVQRFAIEGMCCDSCGVKLYAAVKKVPGVREAAIDPILGRADVVATRDVESAVLARALTFGKYTATPTQ